MYSKFFCRRVSTGVVLPSNQVLSDEEFLSKCVGIGIPKAYASSRLQGKRLGTTFFLNLSPAQKMWFTSSIS